MKIFSQKLKNGLRAQLIQIPESAAATVMILVGAGSRYESAEICGISHFLEHMFFKGAKKFKNPKEVAAAIDKFGGEFNAFTGKEYCGYFVKSGKKNLKNSLEVLADMLIFSKFDAAEIEKERGVILEEMAMYLDAPMYQISWDFERLVFGDQPLGRDQIGTKKLIQNVTRKNFLNYKNSLYVPENIVISVAGNFDEKIFSEIENFFGNFFGEKKIFKKKFDEKLATEKFKIRTKKTEQFHISCGVRAIAERDKNFWALKILATILGGNMSSRMFQSVREKKSLAYSIRTTVDEFSDTGLLRTAAGVRLEKVENAVAAILHEYEKIRARGISLDELKNAQNFLCGRIDLSTEDTENIAHHFAKNLLLYGDAENFSDEKNQILKTKKNDVENLAQKILAPQNLRLAAIGPRDFSAKINF